MIDIPLPAVLGAEVAGVVEQVGEGVEGLAVGDEVFGGHFTGGYAQYTVLPAGLVAPASTGCSSWTSSLVRRCSSSGSAEVWA